MIRSFPLLLWLLSADLFIVHAQRPPATCDHAAFVHRVAELHAAQMAGLAIPVTSEDETEVSPEAIKQIQAFKNALYASLQLYFSCQPDRPPNAASTQADLTKALDISLPVASDREPVILNPGGPPVSGLYLSDITIAVQAVPDSRQLVAVLTSFGIPYGNDAELDVFSPDKDRRWMPALHFTSRPYNSIYGGFQGLQYKIAPPDKDGSWFAVATHVNPWPTSCWQAQFTDVLRPQDLGFNDEFFHDEEYGYICVDDTPDITHVTANTFEVRLRIPSVDESQLESATRIVYRVSDEEAIRIQPVALNPVNFVDEWLRRKWRDSRDWSATPNLTSLRKIHVAAGGGDFVALRRCSTKGRDEVQFTPLEGSDIFFTVATEKSKYTMLVATRHHNPVCRGTNRLESITER